MERLVSVVIPTCDRPDYLRLAVESVLAQRYRHLEIIVHDNASTVDPTPLMALDPRIRVIRCAVNIGQTANILAGIGCSHGDYVALLGDDDIWTPSFVARLVEVMEADVVASFCDHEIIDPEGRLDEAASRRVRRKHRRDVLAAGVHHDIERVALVYQAIPVLSGALIRREAIDWSLVPRDLPTMADIWIDYLLALSGGKAVFVKEPLMRYRYHPAQRMAADVANREELARFSLFLWGSFAADARLRHRGYYRLVCCQNALRLGAQSGGCTLIR